MAAAAAAAADSKASCSSGEAHRARAARGPTSLEQLTAHAAEQTATPQGAEQPQQQESPEQQRTPEQQQVQESALKDGAAAGKECSGASAPSDAAGAADHAARKLQALSVQHTEQQQDKQADETSAQTDAAAQQAVGELEQLTAAVQKLTTSVRIFLLTGDLKRSLTGKAGYARRFAAATVGHRHVHLLGPEYGLAGVMQDSGPVLAETAANMLQLNGQQVAAFEAKLLELAAAAGFQKHPAFAAQQQAAVQAQAGQGPADADAVVGSVDRGCGSGWRLPPGHLALQAQH